MSKHLVSDNFVGLECSGIVSYGDHLLETQVELLECLWAIRNCIEHSGQQSNEPALSNEVDNVARIVQNDDPVDIASDHKLSSLQNRISASDCDHRFQLSYFGELVQLLGNKLLLL